MAGLTWFELDVDMPDDPKCVALGVRMRNPLAFGYVVRLYAYCYRHGTDTFMGLGAPGTIENACGWRGRVGQLLAALMAEGFIDHVPAATYVVHGVGERLGPHLAKKERDAERMRERRANVARTFQRPPRDVRGDKDKDKDREAEAAGTRPGLEVSGRGSPPTPPAPSGPLYPETARMRIVLSERLARPPNSIPGPKSPDEAEELERRVAKVGADRVAEWAAQKAKDRGISLRGLGLVLTWLRDGDQKPAEAPKKKREPGQNPEIGDPDYDRPDSWWSLAAFNARPRKGNAA